MTRCSRSPIGRSMRSWRTSWATALLLAALPATADWSEFAPDHGRFTVQMPGAPARERHARFTPVGYVYQDKYWLRVNDVLLAVEMHDLPTVASALLSDDSILDQAQQGLLSDVNGTLLEGRPLVFQGAPAREFTYRLPGKARLEERVLVVLIAKRLYIVTGMARAPGSDPDVARFFDSFRCWPESAAADADS